MSKQESHALPKGSPDPSTDRLIQWFRENDGWLSPDVTIAYDESHGLHVVAIRPLSSPVIVKCPLTLTVSHLNLDHSQSIVPRVKSQLQRCVGELPNEVLANLLLVEQSYLAKAQKSAWQPYFDCLPKAHEMTTCLWWDDDDLSHLQGTDLLAATRNKKLQLEAQYQDAVATLTRLNVKLDLAPLTFEDYLWAVTIMSSRAFVSTYMLPNINTFPILFPVLDILNHSTDAKVNWTFDNSCFSLEVADPASVLPKSQIFNNYAPKQNGELLLGYGFCVPENPIEQFAIKMRLPPDMVDAARDVGLYDPDQVPFGLPPSIVHSDQSAEQHFLRPRGHPFGRYENEVPWLQGIPPWIVHSTFVATVMQMGHTPENTGFRKPAGILVLHTLLQIYEAVRAKSILFPTQPDSNGPTTPANINQRHAIIYRKGQASVIHAIRAELETVLSSLRVRNRVPALSTPALITTTEALLALQEEYPQQYAQVQKAIATTYNVDISSQQPIPADQEKDLWTILVFLFGYLALTSPQEPKSNGDGLIRAWTLEYLEIYTLPSLASLPSTDFDEATLGSFIYDTPAPITYLNDLHASLAPAVLDERYADLPVWDDDDDVGLRGLGDKLLIWATAVVDAYAVALPVEVEDGEERVGLYVRAYREGGSAEETWVYENVDGKNGGME